MNYNRRDRTSPLAHVFLQWYIEIQYIFVSYFVIRYVKQFINSFQIVFGVFFNGEMDTPSRQAKKSHKSSPTPYLGVKIIIRSGFYKAKQL